MRDNSHITAECIAASRFTPCSTVSVNSSSSRRDDMIQVHVLLLDMLVYSSLHRWQKPQPLQQPIQ
jgi:hypothetical protein